MSIEVKLAFDVLAFISVMVLIVLGLGVIASMMGIFNFAHGEFVLLGAYTVYLFESSGLSAWAGIVAGATAATGAGTAAVIGVGVAGIGAGAAGTGAGIAAAGTVAGADVTGKARLNSVL